MPSHHAAFPRLPANSTPVAVSFVAQANQKIPPLERAINVPAIAVTDRSGSSQHAQVEEDRSGDPRTPGPRRGRRGRQRRSKSRLPAAAGPRAGSGTSVALVSLVVVVGEVEHVEQVADRRHVARHIGVVPVRHRIGQVVAAAGGKGRSPSIMLLMLRSAGCRPGIRRLPNSPGIHSTEWQCAFFSRSCGGTDAFANDSSKAPLAGRRVEIQERHACRGHGRLGRHRGQVRRVSPAGRDHRSPRRGILLRAYELTKPLAADQMIVPTGY